MKQKVVIERLVDLKNHKYQEKRQIDALISQLRSEVKGPLRSIQREYSESYVRSDIERVESRLRRIEKLSRELNDRYEGKIYGLKEAINIYTREEQNLKRLFRLKPKSTLQKGLAIIKKLGESLEDVDLFSGDLWKKSGNVEEATYVKDFSISDIPEIPGYKRDYLNGRLQWRYTGEIANGNTEDLKNLIDKINTNGEGISIELLSQEEQSLIKSLLGVNEIYDIYKALEDLRIQCLLPVMGINIVEKEQLEELLSREEEGIRNETNDIIKELEYMDEIRALSVTMIGDISAYTIKAENGSYYQEYLKACESQASAWGTPMVLHGQDVLSAFSFDKDADPETLYVRYVKNSSDLVKATGILDGLKDLDVSELSFEQYINYMGPIWELNKNYRGLSDELDDVKVAIQILGTLFAGMSIGYSVTGMVVAEAGLDLADSIISFATGDKLGAIIGIIAVVLPEIAEVGMKSGKSLSKEALEDMVSKLSKSDYDKIIKGLEDQGINNVKRLDIDDNMLKIVRDDDIIMVDLTKNVLEGTSNLTLTSTLLKNSTCSNDELYNYLLKNSDLDTADIYLKDGSWPEGIQIPKNPSVLNIDGTINWSKAAEGGYTLDSQGDAIKESFIPEIGEVIDRYGNPYGRYTSPVVDGKAYSYTERSLPYVEDISSYHEYEVIGDFSKIEEYVESCTDIKLKSEIVTTVRKYYKGDYSRLVSHKGEASAVAGWGRGGAIQYEFSLTVDQLVRLKLLQEVR